MSFYPAKTLMFPYRLRDMHLSDNCVVESFDMAAFYTNVSDAKAL